MSDFEKKYKLEIEEFFEAPKPKRRQQFLREAESRKEDIYSDKISLRYMVMIQISYISKWVWILSVLLFIIAFILCRFIHKEILWAVSAVIPFIVTISLAECMRSVVYGMGELEMASRFSLKNVIMTRMFILGVCNMILLFAVVAASGNGMWKNIVYMLVPYLSTAAGGMEIFRMFPAREGTFMSCGFAVIISAVDVIAAKSYSWIYDAQFFGFWVISVIILLSVNAYGYRRIIRDVA